MTLIRHILASTSRAIVMMAVVAACFSATALAEEAKPKKARGPIISVDVAANTVTIDHKKKGN